jgi:hypothetical protein
MRVHYFYLKAINKVLYGQNHCLLLIKNSHNQPQQELALSAQKSSNLTGKCRLLLDIFSSKQVECSPCKYLYYHAILYSKHLTYYCKFLTLGNTKISYFLAFLTKFKLI